MTVPPRLRQICLVAERLAPVADDLAAVLGLRACHSDPNVRRYGLENVLLPIDAVLLEIVAPVEQGTAAGRFLAKSGGRGGYMAIFSCPDPDERRRAAERLGVRVAHVIDHPPYRGVQLHPRDCRAAFIEFNHTAGSDDIYGPYPPAGPNWTDFIRRDVTRRLAGITLQSPEPAALAAHWAAILGVDAAGSAPGAPCRVALPNAVIDVVHGPGEALTALQLTVADPDAVRAAAAARGYRRDDGAIVMAGVELQLAA